MGGCLGSEGPPFQEDESIGIQSMVFPLLGLYRAGPSSVDGFTSVAGAGIQGKAYRSQGSALLEADLILARSWGSRRGAHAPVTAVQSVPGGVSAPAGRTGPQRLLLSSGPLPRGPPGL